LKRETKTVSNQLASVRSVRRAVDCLQFLAASPGSVTVTEIARELGLALSTTHRILATLQQVGLVDHDPSSHHYRIGSGVIRLARRPLHDEEHLRRVAQPILEALHSKTRETIHLAVLRGTEVVVIEQIESPRTLLVRQPVGVSLPPHATAVGKALLAYAPQVAAAIVATGLPRLTPYTVTDPGEFEAELQRVRELNYAVNDRQRNPDTAGVAAAVFNGWETPVAAIGVSGPASRVTGQTCHALGEETCRAAATLSTVLQSSETA
jgi:DNA-binding IclR family transcriptional regulator